MASVKKLGLVINELLQQKTVWMVLLSMIDGYAFFFYPPKVIHIGTDLQQCSKAMMLMLRGNRHGYPSGLISHHRSAPARSNCRPNASWPLLAAYHRTVLPTTSCSSILVRMTGWRRRRYCATSKCFAATISKVRPLQVWMVGLAPLDRSSSTMGKWPRLAAVKSGVHPHESAKLMSACP